MRPSTILAIALIVIITILLFPLILFALEVPRSPPIFGLQVESDVLNGTHALLRVKVSYNGSIPITNVELELAGKVLELGDLYAGDVKYITTIASVEEFSRLQQQMAFTFRFRVVGLYGIEVKTVG